MPEFNAAYVTTTQVVDLWIPKISPHPFIDPASAVVSLSSASQRSPGDQILCYFEGNRYGAEDAATWLGRVILAGSRALTRYPTTARALIRPSELIPVGTYDFEAATLELVEERIPLLREYLGTVPIS